jgi:hypothetical protein
MQNQAGRIKSVSRDKKQANMKSITAGNEQSLGRAWTLRQTKLYRFGRNAGFIRQGIQSRGSAAA